MSSKGDCTGLLSIALAALLYFGLQSNSAAMPWPGEAWSTSRDLTPLNPAAWAGNLSGAYWNPVTRRLWVCTNGPAKFWALREDGAGGFLVDREYTGTGDLEGITQIAGEDGVVFVVDEQARTIRSYRVSDGSTAASWFLGDIPNWGNSGPEGLAFVPNEWLARNDFADGAGSFYPASVHGTDGFGGVVFVAVQTSGWVYAVDLRRDGSYTLVGRYRTSRGESCEMTFDDTTGRMFILHNIDGNWLEITDLTSAQAGADRQFITHAEVQVPSGSNIEGFALTPALTAENRVGDNWCFFTDDSNANGALRWFVQLHAHMAKHAGDGQAAPADSAVAVAPSVMAVDPWTNPLPQIAVAFSVTSGGGSVTGGAATADSAGIAAVGSWTLGAEPGPNTLAATGAGLDGSPQVFTATGMDVTPPTVDVVDVTPDPRQTAVDTVSIVFSEPVTNFDVSDLHLSRNGGTNLLSGTETLETSDDTTWILNISSATAEEGIYTLSVSVSDIEDLSGNTLTAGAADSWTTVVAGELPSAGSCGLLLLAGALATSAIRRYAKSLR